jgi:hypothetical protein
MNAAIVTRTLSLIPDRVIRTQSGCLFDPQAPGACAHPERITHLAQFLNWLGPLREVTKDDLRVFGLLSAYGKPVSEAAMDDEADGDLDAELEAPVEVEATVPVALPAVEPSLPALT